MKNPYYICDRLILTFKIHFMNKILRYSLIMVLGLFSTVQSFGAIYTHVFAKDDITAEGDVTLTGVSWNLACQWNTASTYFGWDTANTPSKGIQIGSGSKSANAVVLKTSGFSGEISAVVINTSTASSAVTTLSLSVGGTSFGTKDLTNTSTDYTFTPKASGELIFTFSQPSTLKALYIKSISVYTNGDSPTPPTLDVADDISSFIALATGTEANLTLTNAQVLYADATNKNVYIKDATGALCFYNAGLNLTTGDILNGSVAGKLSIYNNLPEFTANTLTNVDKITKTAGAAPTPVDVTVAQANSMQYVSQLVRLSGVKLDSVGSNLMAIQNGDSIQIYDSFKSLTGVKLTTPSENNNLTGILIIYKTTYEIYPLTIDGYETASISNVNGVSNLNAPIYNLAGQQVNESYKGVVIRNGKKFIQK